jgi:SAM-dependent MidA family methyltransferase
VAPSGRAAESDPALVALIRREVKLNNGITFERFMELALYEPAHGYYARSSDQATRSGDYLSAPETHALFGHALARLFEDMWSHLDRPAGFTIREYGAGTGALAVSVLEGLRADAPELLRELRYEPLDMSPERNAAIAERLRLAGFESVVARVPRNGGAITGCIVANELIDAFPVHRVVGTARGIAEVFVVWRDGWFGDEPREPSTPTLAEYLDASGIRLAEGQQAEINLRAREWLRHVATELERGYVLVIDYGHDAAELYGQRRFAGTLLGYRGHSISDDPYDAIGRQDLTAHVDLTGLERGAREAGLEVVGRTTQAELLTGLGLGDLLVRLGRTPDSDPGAYVAARAAVVRLIDPRATGRFAVLAFGRDVPREPLRGFAFKVTRD